MTQNRLRLHDLFRYYRELPHQNAAITELEEAIIRVSPGMFNRDQQWFKTWSHAGKQPEADLKPALDLIKKWEGCRLEAYLCPANVPTIGYGHTGPDVRMGMTIRQDEAEAMLLNDLQRFAKAVDFQINAPLNNNQRCALISFTFNVGTGALLDSTLRKRLNSGENPNKVAMEELPRWNKGGGGVLQGLVNRRKDEVDLFVKGGQKEAPSPAQLFTPDKPWDFKITPNITYGELTLREEARRFTRQQQCDTALELCKYLEKVRTHFGGKPIVITSGHRPPAINASVGGSSKSEHLYNMDGVGAIDFYIAGVDIYKVQEYVDQTWQYSLGYGAPKGFVHLGMRLGKPRVRWDY